MPHQHHHIRIIDQIGKIRVRIEEMSTRISELETEIQRTEDIATSEALTSKKTQLCAERYQLVTERKRLTAVHNETKAAATAEKAKTTKQALEQAHIVCSTLSTSGSESLRYARVSMSVTRSLARFRCGTIKLTSSDVLVKETAPCLSVRHYR
jgi:chromosome segregation ATPase